ncbi:MAG: thioredoxin domain-containing protein [Chloroflexota bacterium]
MKTLRQFYPRLLLIGVLALVGCGWWSDEAEDTSSDTELETSTVQQAEEAPSVPEEDTTTTELDPPSQTEAVAEAIIEETIREEGMPNRLIDEKSPYLLQHAYNPVDWFPWGEEAFAQAAAEDKPIFLSIGYSTCHWCHVMEDESFEDEEVAALMNEAFISVKVDREERPDIDGIYMTVAQLTGNRGGWPLTIIMTPDQRPFFVATYIPKESRFQRTGMVDLIPQLTEVWQTRRADVLDYGDRIVEALQAPQSAQISGFNQAGPSELLGTNTLASAYNQLQQRFDPVHGGFSTAPKFPAPHNMLFLLRYWQRTGDEQALHMVETTLRAMRQGGVYDQIGYGFHRYSTDERWKLPHFEKMLYDQAMLSMAYTETYQATEDDWYQQIAREIFTYVLRDMTAETGSFYSAEDADSEGEEGIFYMWGVAELQTLLGDEDANLIITMSKMSQQGNFLEEATRAPIGRNIIYWDETLPDVAAALGLTPNELTARFERIRPMLFEAREKRIHPHKDDKILTDWNGLMIAALAKAGRAFEEPAYIEAASQSADFVLATLKREDGRLLHRYRDGEAAILANVDDYAFLIWGLLELYEATFNLTYLEEAIALNAELETYFWDEDAGAFYFTPDDGETLIARQKVIYDGAIPSGNSIAMMNLLRLGRITADASYEARAYQVSQTFQAQITAGPTAYTQLMSALEFGVGPSYEVIIVGEENGADTEAMLTALRDQYVPNKVVLLRSPHDDDPLVQLADYTKYYYAIDEQATAYVCQNYICEFPTTDPAKMVTLLYNDE